MKTEPSVFSFEDLIALPKGTTHWEGVRNYQARNLMRDEFKVGDRVLIYHSNAEPIGIAGVAEVVRAGYPDNTALDPKNRYYDRLASKKQINPWCRVDVKAVARFENFVSREDLKVRTELSKMMVLRKGSRLSVQPVTPAEYRCICEMGQMIAL